VQALVADIEAGSHRQVVNCQLVQALVLGVESPHQGLHRPCRPGGQAGAGDPQGQRQSPAQLHELGNGLRFGRHLVPPGQQRHQRHGIRKREHVQV
jgi:hypothetical protein